MTGLNMQDFKEALKGNHEIEFLYKDKEFVNQPEKRGESAYLVIWQSGNNAICIAERLLPGDGQISDEDIDFLLSQRCFAGQSFSDVERDIVISLVY